MCVMTDRGQLQKRPSLFGDAFPVDSAGLMAGDDSQLQLPVNPEAPIPLIFGQPSDLWTMPAARLPSS
jgi:hypothetical protein